MKREVKPKRENYTQKQLENLDKLEKMEKEYNKSTPSPEKISRRRFFIILSVLLVLLVTICIVLVVVVASKGETLPKVAINLLNKKINPLVY